MCLEIHPFSLELKTKIPGISPAFFPYISRWKTTDKLQTAECATPSAGTKLQSGGKKKKKRKKDLPVTGLKAIQENV